MPIQNRFTSPPADPPEVRGQVRVFRSREHLVAWHEAIHDGPMPLMELAPLCDRDVSRALGDLAGRPRGGVLYLHTGDPGVARRLRGWVTAAEDEHQPGALSGPYPVRVGDEGTGLLVGVTHNAAPTFWDHVEPDGWPVMEASARLDPRRVERLVRTSPFAAPVGTSAADHDDAVLVSLGAKRALRGALVPTVAGLVALGEQAERHLPGLAVALRRAGDHDRVLTGSIAQLCERVTGEARWWGAVDREAARTLLVLALAERAWAGEQAATPITITRASGLLTLAIPCAPANARERKDRAPANPRLRQILVRLGELPGDEDGPPDNDHVLGVLRGRLPGARCRWGSMETRLEVPVEEGAVGVLAVGVRPALASPQTGGAMVQTVAVDPASAITVPAITPPAIAPPASPAPPSSSSTAPTQNAAPPPSGSPALQRLPQPKRPRLPPVLHPRPSAPAALPVPASATPLAARTDARMAPPTGAALPAPPEPKPAVTSAAPAAGPLTLEERKSQIRDLFSQADRPLGAREIADTLGVHRDTLRAALSALVAEGWLATTDPNPRSPVQRYRRVVG